MYVYNAIQRAKDNGGVVVGPVIIREAQYEHQTEEEIIALLKARCQPHNGVWRIYRSLNKRDPLKAKLELVDTLIKQMAVPESVTDKNVESLWKTLLMRPLNRAENFFLIDLDTNDIVIKNAIMSLENIVVLSVSKTPNGYHLVCEPFDSRLLEPWEKVASVKRDALLYLSIFTVNNQ